ncbi:hypothetical protein GGF48_003800, partial [Coemansia sp. RSA 921]
LALAQAQHDKWKNALPAFKEEVKDQVNEGKAEMDATIAAAHEKYAKLTAEAQTSICKMEQEGMNLEAKSEHLQEEVQACMAKACPMYQATMGRVDPAPKGKAKPVMADIMGRRSTTEESEKDPQQAAKEWKEYEKAAMPPPC